MPEENFCPRPRRKSRSAHSISKRDREDLRPLEIALLWKVRRTCRTFRCRCASKRDIATGQYCHLKPKARPKPNRRLMRRFGELPEPLHRGSTNRPVNSRRCIGRGGGGHCEHVRKCRGQFLTRQQYARQRASPAKPITKRSPTRRLSGGARCRELRPVRRNASGQEFVALRDNDPAE